MELQSGMLPHGLSTFNGFSIHSTTLMYDWSLLNRMRTAIAWAARLTGYACLRVAVRWRALKYSKSALSRCCGHWQFGQHNPWEMQALRVASTLPRLPRCTAESQVTTRRRPVLR